MVVFQNKGLIDLRGITTFGVCVKETDSPIGYFGTGLKYAIAVLLRHKQEVTLYRGDEVFQFTTRQIAMRNKTFDAVFMNDTELPFTTDLGKNWEPWMAYRELYCNVLDEEGVVTDEGSNECASGDTVFLVQGAVINEIHQNRGRYFLDNREPVHVGSKAEAYSNEASLRGVFYKGILVHHLDETPLYTYNLTGQHTLTEDRTLNSVYDGKRAIRGMIQQSVDRNFISDVLLAHPNSFEGCLDYGSWCEEGHGDTFLDVIGELRKKYKDHRVNKSAIAIHRRKRELSILPTESIALSVVQQKQLDKALNFCREGLGMDIDKFPLIVCADLGSGNLGRADPKTMTMYISKLCFDEGTKRVAAALLEEWTHLEHDVADETIEQKWVYLQQILSLGERLMGDPL
jgi:hypothetical protein